MTDVKDRVVRLDELDPDARRLILALINAQAQACANGHHVMEGDRCKYATAHLKEVTA